ncbi:MAG: lytic transglycosylase domain-containing protein, partial [Polaromonas sp.]|nr:lytic transglycosylase domain-containing protein [Polaromonas sp.]
MRDLAPASLQITRRRCLQALSAATSVLLISEQTWAGAQIEEPLIDPVRNALSSAIASQAPPVPEFRDTETRLAYLRWLGAMSDRLRKKKPDWQMRKEFLQTVWYESKRAGLDVALVLGLIQVESNFRKFAVSRVGARGYMQVMPFWTRVIGDGDPGKLFHMQTNLRFGCVILRHYLDREKGDLFMGLGR